MRIWRASTGHGQCRRCSLYMFIYIHICVSLITYPAYLTAGNPQFQSPAPSLLTPDLHLP